MPLKPSELLQAILLAMDADVPLMIHGQPGVGKSAIVAQAAAMTGRKMIDVRLSQLDPVDLRGMLHVENRRTHWLPPVFWPDNTTGPSLLFLDEINAAAQSVIAAAYQIVRDRRVGEHFLPPDCRIILAGNRQADRAITVDIGTAMHSRMDHVTLETDLADFQTWYFDQPDLPAEILAFLRFCPDSLNTFDPTKRNQSFGCPRSWEHAARMHTQLEAKGLATSGIALEMQSGNVGQGNATALLGFLRVYAELPDPDACLLNPDTITLPHSPSARWALCTALARRASQSTMPALCTIAGRLPDEFGMLLVKLATRHDPTSAKTKAFIQYQVSKQELFKN
jgi:hypothetical protein